MPASDRPSQPRPGNFSTRKPGARKPALPLRPEPPPGRVLPASFFDRDAQAVAQDLLGTVLCHRQRGRWLMAQLVEVEAYYLEDKASHASLGFTPKRRALFMPPGTIYMYFARGGDSFNISCRGDGNAVLLKAGVPYLGGTEVERMLAAMRRNNPLPSGVERAPERLCAGQTLLCRALGLRVPVWDGQELPLGTLCLVDVGYRPDAILRTRRLGIPVGRDEHLPYRFVDAAHAASCTRNPLRRGAQEGVDYQWCGEPQPGTGP